MSADPPAATKTEPAKQPRQNPLEPFGVAAALSMAFVLVGVI